MGVLFIELFELYRRHVDRENKLVVQQGEMHLNFLLLTILIIEDISGWEILGWIDGIDENYYFRISLVLYRLRAELHSGVLIVDGQGYFGYLTRGWLEG